MAISNRYSSMARPNLIITECRFIIPSMPKDIRKLESRSNGRIKSYGHFEPLLKPDTTRPHHHRISIPHPVHAKGHPENSSKSLVAIQRSDQKLWPFRTVTRAWRDQTSSSPRIHSSSTQWKSASGNSSTSLTAIQRSYQKLWPFRTVTLAWRDQTSSSPHIHSSSTQWKRASGNSSTSLTAIQRSAQS